MDRARVRAKGEAEQAALDFSRLTRAPGPGTYPLQVPPTVTTSWYLMH